MILPFTVEQFFGVFARYNNSVWPAQFVIYALGVLATALSVRRCSRSSQIVVLILSSLWLWMGIVYHIVFFAAINDLAIAFGVLFIIQGGFLLWTGLWKRQLSFHARMNASGLAGSLFIVYALVVYPALGFLLGHRYPAVPTFGLPCPTTIFTFGLLLWTDLNVPLLVLVIPAIWSVLGFLAAVQLNVPQDIGLPAAGLIGTILLVMRNRRSPHSAANGI